MGIEVFYRICSYLMTHGKKIWENGNIDFEISLRLFIANCEPGHIFMKLFRQVLRARVWRIS